MQNLDKRISALEQAQPQGEKVLFIILVGMRDEEINHIYDNHENHWHRRHDETEEAFKDRATSETPRDENRIAMLFGERQHTTV